jgi:hypothetical protein
MPCTLLYVLRSRHIAKRDDDSVRLVRAAVLRVSCVLFIPDVDIDPDTDTAVSRSYSVIRHCR